MSINDINSPHVGKNYSTDGGDTLVIGGKLVIKEGAEVEGLGNDSEYELPIASSETLGGIKVGSGLAIDANGVLSADSQTPSAATTTTMGVVKMMENQAEVQGSNLLGLEEAFNSLLQNLKAAGLMAPDAE